jgi:drug/metabolite transporter (DMT)-like permease
MLGLTLTCICAVAWASFDVLRKRLSATISPAPLLVLLNAGLVPMFGLWWLIAGALAQQIVANLLFLAAVRASPLSATVPMLALTPVFATLLGVLLLDERPTPAQLLGIGLVVVGAVALSVAGQSQTIKPLREPGAWMMLGVAACWGVTIGLDKRAMVHAAAPVHGFIQLSGVLVAGLVYLLLTRRAGELKQARAQLGTLAFAILAGSAAFGFQLAATQAMLVSQIETIKRGFGLVGAVVFGKLIFDEPITAAKLLGILVMVAGVALLMLGTGS